MEAINNLLSSLLSTSSIANTIAALALAYIGGILSSLTPCIYPMIPITVGVVGKGHWASRSLAYVAGMTLIYSFLGVAAGLTGRIFGTLTQTSAWFIVLGIIMTLAALAMMDVIQINPQMFWRSRKTVGAPPNKPPGLVGAFILGASSGTIAAPCTTPVLASILAYITKTQSIGLGLGLMIAFSLGLSTLLLLIAAFAGTIRVLPRSGNWMNIVKVASGIIILAFANYLFYRAGILARL
jgi:thiol:disulfide interchange protein DsbD